MHLLSNCDLLSQRTLYRHHFPGNYRHFSSRRRVRGAVNMGGRSKNTLAIHYFFYRRGILVRKDPLGRGARKGRSRCLSQNRAHTKRVVQQRALLRRLLRRVLETASRRFLEGFLEGVLQCVLQGGRVLRRCSKKGLSAFRRRKYAFSRVRPLWCAPYRKEPTQKVWTRSRTVYVCVDSRFVVGSPFLLFKIPEFKACRDTGIIPCPI